MRYTKIRAKKPPRPRVRDPDPNTSINYDTLSDLGFDDDWMQSAASFGASNLEGVTLIVPKSHFDLAEARAFYTWLGNTLEKLDAGQFDFRIAENCKEAREHGATIRKLSEPRQ